MLVNRPPVRIAETPWLPPGGPQRYYYCQVFILNAKTNLKDQ